MGRGGGNLPNGQAGGFLGKSQDPFALMADPSKKDFKVPDLLPPDNIGTARIDRRRRMRDIVDNTIRNFETSESAKLMDDNFQSAYRLMTSPDARNAFDLNREPIAVRERYGMHRFGQCCLLARRLIEAGVRFVTINTFLTVFDEISWDIHGSKPFTSIEGMKNVVAPMYDQGYSALIEDLHQRGMLDDTLVCNLAEFGRTPKVKPCRWKGPLATVFHGLLCRWRRTRWTDCWGERPDWGCASREANRATRSGRDYFSLAGTQYRKPFARPGRQAIPAGRLWLSRNQRAVLSNVLPSYKQACFNT